MDGAILSATRSSFGGIKKNIFFGGGGGVGGGGGLGKEGLELVNLLLLGIQI